MTVPNIDELRKQTSMAQSIMETSLKDISSSSCLFEHAAKCYRKLYESLLSEGFTDKQAMSIVNNYNPLK